jgi:SAM-dependent methyltransferase
MKGIIKSKAIHYYNELLEKHGSSLMGLGWKSANQQFLRFQKLIDFIPQEKMSINDLGCGFGDLYGFLKTMGYNDYLYRGYDITPKMILISEANCNEKNAKFSLIQSSQELVKADFTVASGIFNGKMDVEKKCWVEYILNTLHDMNKNSSKGFSFNILTSYSDKECMRKDLFYGEPYFFFNYCKMNFSKYVNLLHDYDLYEFTIVVKKNV